MFSSARAEAAPHEEQEHGHSGARVIPLFRGRQGSAQPLVTLVNGLWRKPDVARHLQVSERTVERWMQLEELPHEKPFGRKGPVRFDPRRVQAWWEARCANDRFTVGAGCALWFCLSTFFG